MRRMILIPGVVETTSNFVEHPEVVARRSEEAHPILRHWQASLGTTTFPTY
jgi:hypothetical protein